LALIVTWFLTFSNHIVPSHDDQTDTKKRMIAPTGMTWRKRLFPYTLSKILSILTLIFLFHLLDFIFLIGRFNINKFSFNSNYFFFKFEHLYIFKIYLKIEITC